MRKYKSKLKFICWFVYLRAFWNKMTYVGFSMAEKGQSLRVIPVMFLPRKMDDGRQAVRRIRQDWLL